MSMKQIFEPFWAILGGSKMVKKFQKYFFRNLHEESFNSIYNNNTYQSHLKKQVFGPFWAILRGQKWSKSSKNIFFVISMKKASISYIITIHTNHNSKNRFLGHLGPFGPKSGGPYVQNRKCNRHKIFTQVSPNRPLTV